MQLVVPCLFYGVDITCWPLLIFLALNDVHVEKRI